MELPVDGELRRRGDLRLVAALALSWLAFVASVMWRPDPGQFSVWYDVGLYDLPFLVAGAACWRSGRRIGGANAWRPMAVGLVVFVLGNVYGSLVVGDRDIYPSPADGLWLAFYVFVYVAIVRLIRSRVARFHASTWLDGGVAGLGMAALVVAFALGPALDATDGRFAVVATNIAYPTAEIVLIVVLVAAVTALGLRDRSFWLVGGGLTVFCVADVVYLFREAADTYVEGGVLDIAWPLGAAFLGVAALADDRDHAVSDGLSRGFVVPAAFGVGSVALLVVGQRHQLPMVAIVLAAASLGVAVGRVVLTVREVRRLADSRREARTDDLTGLGNRRRLVEHLQATADGAHLPVALCLIDLDRFKEVNDSLGHLAGDLLLCAVARRMETAVPKDAVLTRLGGDEYAVTITDGSGGAALALGRELREALRAPFEVGGMQVSVDASVGVAWSPEHGTTADQLLSSADIAMYRAKRQRTGVELFDPVADSPSRDRLALLADLREALAAEQFELHYQPQIDLAADTVLGVEALVRWRHPTRGFVPPGDFLPALEQTDRMTSLTAFVVRRAIADAAWFDGAGWPLRMSVNVSASDLVGTSLTDVVTGELSHHAVDAARLVIEVTEDTVMTDRTASLETLQRLRDLGVQVSVDDYGTGRASLSYIRDLPITEMKLDRIFLVGVPADGHNAAIVRSTIELAHSLGLPLVAEGVEDEGALRWLGTLGCDVAQGFHIARPLARDDLSNWLRSRSTVRAAERGDEVSLTMSGRTGRP